MKIKTKNAFYKITIYILINICFINYGAPAVFGDNAFELAPLIVTAERRPAAGAQEHFTVELDDARPLIGKTLADSAESIPFVFLPSGGGPGAAVSPRIMGGSSSQTLVLFDGRPINSPALGSFNLNLLPAEAFGGIEVFYGPVSSRYGAGGLSGAVNLSSPAFAGTGGRTVVKTFVSSHGGFEQTVRTSAANPRGGGKHSIFFKRHIYGGYRPNSDFKVETVSYSHEFGAGRRTEGRFSFLHSSSANGVPGPLPAQGSAPPAFGDPQASSLFDRQADALNFAALDLSFDAGKGRTLSLKLFNDLQNGYFSTRHKNWNGGTVLDASEVKTRRRGSYLNYKLPLRRATFTAGVGRTMDSLASRESAFDLSSSTELSPAENSPSSAASSFWAHYGGGGPSLYFEAGVSRDRSGRFEPADSYSAGVSKRIGGSAQLKFYHARGHRAPTLNDLYYPGAGNPALRAEKGTFNSVSVSGSSGGVTGRLTLFGKRTDDMIEWFPDPSDASGFRWTPQNINSMNARGLSLSLDAPAGRTTFAGLYLEAARYRQKNLEEIYNDFAGTRLYAHTEREARQLPSRRASFRLYGDASPRLGFSVAASYASKMCFYYSDYSGAPAIRTLEKTIGSAVTADLFLSYKLRGDERFDFSVENIFDRQYSRRFGSSFSDRDFPMPGRVWKAAISKWF